MKVSELIKALERHPDNEAVIPVKLPHATMGGHPIVPIKGAFAGFDWDHGNTFLQPEADLYPAGPQFKDAATLNHELSERIGWALMALLSNVPDSERVKMAIRNLMPKRPLKREGGER